MVKEVEIKGKVEGDLILPSGSYEHDFFIHDFTVERHLDARRVKAAYLTFKRGYIGGWFLGENLDVLRYFKLEGVEIGGALDLEEASAHSFEILCEYIFREVGPGEVERLRIYPRIGEEFHAPRLKSDKIEFYHLKVGRNLDLSGAKIGKLHLSRCEVNGMLSLRGSKVGEISFSEGRYKVLDVRGSKIKKFYGTALPELREVLVDGESELPQRLVDLLLSYFPDNRDIRRARVRK